MRIHRLHFLKSSISYIGMTPHTGYVKENIIETMTQWHCKSMHITVNVSTSVSDKLFLLRKVMEIKLDQL